MKPIIYGKLVLFFVVAVVQSVFPKGMTFEVGKTGATYTSIQAAVNAAGSDDTVLIIDDGVYAEQVTIERKDGVVLRSKDIMAASKPTIKHQDTENVGPKSVEEAKILENTTFDLNGALQIIRSKRVIIEGIKVDGGGPYPFGWPTVWQATDEEGNPVGNVYPLFHGNGAVSLKWAGDAIIRYCDITNAFIGINVKDRSVGGVFANRNPSDVDTTLPFSTFTQTGNHVFEHNRIHDNSYGIYFESPWDLGTTIRYNLIYENHHTSATVAAMGNVDAGSEPGNYKEGGAILTKEHLLSPLAIYNNTFWHNRFIFPGLWKTGAHHLVFNNIYGEPDKYFDGLGSEDMSKCYVNRMHNSVYAAMSAAPANNVQVFGGLEINSNATEGDRLPPFPSSAEIRWLETKFLSTTPSADNFLEPDWGNNLVQQYIVNKGWEAAGTLDPNKKRGDENSRVDLGAKANSGGRFYDIITVKPTAPVFFEGNKAVIGLNIFPRIGQINNPVVKYAAVVTDLDTSDSWMNAYEPIPASRITTIDAAAINVRGGALKHGSNVIEISGLTEAQMGEFAFFEFIIEGTDEEDYPVFTTVGFIPYRRLDYKLEVEVQDATTKKKITEVKVGVPVNIHLEAIKISTGQRVSSDVIAKLALSMGDHLFTIEGNILDSVPLEIKNGTADVIAVFHKVPIGDYDRVTGSGEFSEAAAQTGAFLGTSDDIKILPGDPDHVIWRDPQSKGTKTVNINTQQSVRAEVYDLYDNLITTPPVEVKAVSLEPNKGIISDSLKNTDGTTGSVTFYATITDGNKNDTFPIVASIQTTGKSDTAYMIVGDARDKFWIFYSDTNEYNEAVKIDTCTGIRVPIVIRAIKTGSIVSTDKQNTFNIILSDGLAVYADETSPTKITSGKLVNGEVKLWLQSVALNVNNGNIRITSGSDVDDGTRDGITFKPCFNNIVSATYFADNGFGSVNRLEIYYTEERTAEEIPDSFQLWWPSKANENQKMIITRDATGALIPGVAVLDPENARHLTVTIGSPFAANNTSIVGTAKLGIAHWFNTKTPEAPSTPEEFSINDGVGPLIFSAILVENLKGGTDDTIYVKFTEQVSADKAVGLTLYHIKSGSTTPVELEVKSATPDPDDNLTIKVVISSTYNVSAGDTVKRIDPDSLKIISTGTITDAIGNHAHVDNRPVPIILKAVPADISGAVYLDKNADGQIDAVKIWFKKNIDPKNTFIKLYCGTDTATFTDAQIIMLTPDSAEIPIVNFAISPDDQNNKVHFLFETLRNKTLVDMNVTAVFIGADFKDDNEREAEVKDGAAPLIDTVRYHFGKVKKAIRERDTLFVKFTEGLKNTPNPPDEISILTTGQYTLKYVSGTGTYLTGGNFNGYYRYIIDSLAVAAHSPADVDSVWINTVNGTENVVDANGNAQLNPNNRKAILLIHILPVELVLEAGPQPYYPSTVGSSMLILLRPDAEEDVTTVYTASLTIYDKVGNVVKRFPEKKGTTLSVNKDPEFPKTGEGVWKGKAYAWWDGINSNGRKVGSGTYLCTANGSYISNKNQIKINKKLLLGVAPKK